MDNNEAPTNSSKPANTIKASTESLTEELTAVKLEGRISALEVKVNLLLYLGTTVFAVALVALGGATFKQFLNIGRDLGSLTSKVDGYDKQALVHLLSDVRTDGGDTPIAKELKQTFESVAHDVLEKKRRGEVVQSGLYYELGVFSYNNGKPEDAINYFKQATSENSYDYRAFSSMGACYLLLALKHREQEDQVKYYADTAVQALKKAIQIQPKHVEAHDNLGIAYYLLGNRNDAIDEWNSTIRIDYKYNGSYYNLAAMYARENDRRKAVEYLALAIENYGYNDLTQIDSDDDLNNVRSEPKFSELRKTIMSRSRNVIVP